MLVLFVFVTMLNNAPMVLTGLETREACESMRSHIEASYRSLNTPVTISGCFPVQVSRASTI